ncbi:hypothetical protein M409DRAFT_62071 [Zasmidium cellare ATCC 36951]|uniref:DNA (cytosine-5-)-methyltransferase n=1 Tax=Zasmidium cellare ATCC 36951 TaxID=1080233 RepID=A0A6A6D3X9_ZASCE|nr:uncharacterized protein M409DRAFT_62071 [Zasmidium cellare ATCC 36951]KAF2173823.1 hypothetical protein M409DRAFT_62071 [Zasmidium cellare ATCC 36951]
MKRRSDVSPNWHNKRLRGSESAESSDGATPLKSALLTPGTVKVYRQLSHVAALGPPLPRSAYEGWTPTCKQVSESEAIDRLLQAHKEAHPSERPEYTYFELNDFSVYRPTSSYKHALELATLDLLSQDRSAEFLFDGVLSVGDEKCYLRGVPFRILAIDGYGELESTDLARQMCIQTPLAQRKDVWYSLGEPSVEYQRFYTPFLWLARFTKHFVDYLLETEKVTLHHFQTQFHQWLDARYSDDSFTCWMAEANLTDFRTTVVAHFGFLHKECYSIDFDLCKHPVWKEMDPNRLTAIPEQPNKEHRTIVTPYAYDCFRSMYFGDHLERREMKDSAIHTVLARKETLRLTPQCIGQQKAPDTLTPLSMGRNSPESLTSLDPGDVVSVTPDSNSKWTSTGDMWYAYVQRVRHFEDRTLLDVLWLYEPGDTTIGKASYPFKNELFMSDNCSCGKDALDLECAVEKVRISWFAADPNAETGLFVRQKFRTIHEQDSYDFVALQYYDFTCHCHDQVPIFEECRSKYSVGDTVLVREWNKIMGEDRLQPAQIVDFDCAKMRIQLRSLLRKSEVDQTPGTRPNELVVTDDLFDKPASSIVRRCHVRFFTHEQVKLGDIVTPYDRDGAGDHWFVARDGHTDEHQTPPFPSSDGKLPSINQGWDPNARPPKPKLTGLGIFCGGGTFDRGLEEGGGVKFRYAVDWAEKALHSYRANVHRPESVHYFLGSVNDYLARAMAGDKDNRIAGVGKVNFISAGSPCPGFSALQNDKNSVESRRNASMVASVVSFVDFYVPEYFVLENVVTMTNSMGPKKDENVFSQIVAALVGLGYQVQQFLMDAWSHGDPQLRSRVFIVASAPGLPPLPQPQHTHSHPRNLKMPHRSLGKSSNGLAFGMRREEYTSFSHISAAEAVADLPHIGDGQSQICVQFPDHRVPVTEPHVNRHRMACVPQLPPGMGLIQAKNTGALRGEPLEHCKRVNLIRSKHNSKMYARVYPDRLFPTVITRMAVGDGIAGRVVHWSQNRILTVMEARRAQGFLDHEVLVGTVKDQIKIVGNSVDRKVALVLGLAFRESWMGVRDAMVANVPETGEADDEEMDVEETTGNSPGYHGDEDAEDARSITEDEKMRIEDNTRIASGYYEEEESQAPSSTDSSPMKAPNVDNRSTKMALLGLTEDDLGEIRIGGFKAINRIFAQKAAEGHPVTLSPKAVRVEGGSKSGSGEQSSPSPR